MADQDPFAAIAEVNRRTILEELRRGAKTVNQLAEGMSISRPAVSQHLKALLDSGLVTVRSEGTRRFYSVDPRGFRKLNLWLDQFWEQ